MEDYRKESLYCMLKQRELRNYLKLLYSLGAGSNGIEDIKRHEFFASIDWDGLLKKEVSY